MITLYHSPQSRSVRVRWMLEELGVDYELVTVDLKQERSAAHLRAHPHGQVPALVDGDLALIESTAICLHLADRFPQANLAPAIGTPDRARYYQWMVYAVATLEQPVLQIFLHSIQLPEAQRSAEQLAAGRQNAAGCNRVLTDAIGNRPYLLGEQFTAADVMIGSTLAWASFMGVLDGFPVLASYVERLMQRPAYQRATAS